ncbi:hypothetical protein ACJ6WF_05785 [Streptomyces sp. MMS24-I2-30]|uniref:hypothetical protein n=1 Tax=Streptomyces sp. MMS24-I2-30 TaxID=3351564 RepID=UPI003896C0F9
MRRSVVIGATGQIGRPTVDAPARAGRTGGFPLLAGARPDLFDHAAEDAWPRAR